MKIELDFSSEHFDKADLKVVACYQKDETFQGSWSDKNLMSHFKGLRSSKSFSGSAGEFMTFTGPEGETVLAVGLGAKKEAKAEQLRKTIAKTYQAISSKKFKTVAIDALSFNCVNDKAKAAELITESLQMSSYTFDKYLANKKTPTFKKICLFIDDKKAKKAVEKAVEKAQNVTSSVNFTRDLVNEAPNVLHSEGYAKAIEADVKKNLKGVKVKVMGKAELKKEKMNLFLSVNAGSAFGPRLVHLTYTPKKATKNTKHIAMVGKGLTFDTGGYSLKPGGSMMGMKFDMAGSATVYGAFRAAVLNNSPYKITCILGMTDNAVSSTATMPDSIVKARNGLNVEILNTDAEGRLVLADCLDYACDQKPDYLIDAATLTGACLVALGSQVCAVLGNDDKWINELRNHAKKQDEYMWQLPIIPEWRDDMKSQIADLKNIGTAGRAGTATAAAFLENFVKNDVKWAHLDIAGVGDSQAHLPYCPSKGASGLIVRTLHDALTNGK
ncbi:MAG: leucyl aminopeptidase [Halobacteriovoraceae bacterium]|nr:leucyl aminopeptidase [Halobacteriovoraceae bacterium]|tara:strand:- start:107934 stop:109430 length:1497 start_codon:yes stop_codon:yes gene_type:complete